MTAQFIYSTIYPALAIISFLFSLIVLIVYYIRHVNAPAVSPYQDNEVKQ